MAPAAADARPSGRRRRWAVVAAYVAAGGAASVVLLLYLWPARALLPLAERVEGLTVWDLRGRWWRGEAHAAAGEQALGQLAWQWLPAGLTAGELRFDWQLAGPSHALGGTVGGRLDGWTLTAAGHVAAAAVNPGLAAYDVRLGGDFALQGVALRTVAAKPPSVTGALHWSGGNVGYSLGDRRLAATLPAMVGRLAVVDGEPTLAVATVPGERLFEVRLAADGWVHVALTKRFLDLAGNPWPGHAADDAVVVEFAGRPAFPSAVN